MSAANEFTVGDTGPALSGTVNANLTGATVALHIRKPDATVLTRTPTVSAPLTGAWSYQWVNGDLDAAGVWTVEAQVTFSSGTIQTFGPSSFRVKAQIA